MKNKTYSLIGISILSLIPLIMTIPLYLFGDLDIKFFLGEFAYCLFIFDIILGLRPKMIEKIIDLKTMYFIHGIIATIAVIFAILHVEMSHLHGFAGDMGNIAYYGSIGTIALAFLFLSHQFLDCIPFVNKIVCQIRNISNYIGLKREFYDLLHVLSPLIVLFIFLHVILISKFSNNHLFMIFFIGYLTIFILFYLYEGVYKKLNVTRYKVIDIEKENNNTYQLTMKYYNGKKLNIKGGQYIFISTKFSKLNEYHPFSVLSIQDNTIKLGIKQCGDFTKQLSNIEIGEIVKIKGVYGHMTPPKNTNNPIIAIAGGIGITPCISLLQELHEDATGELIWSLHDESQLAFKKDLEYLQKTHPNIKIIYHYTSKNGHLNKEIMQQYLINIVDADYYLCGPKPMMNSTIKILHSLNIKDSHIDSEGFIF